MTADGAVTLAGRVAQDGPIKPKPLHHGHRFPAAIISQAVRWYFRFARRVKAARRKPGRTWHPDEMFVYLRGESWLLWRAVDEHGAELNILLLQKQRDKAAAKRFSQRVLRSFPAPRKIGVHSGFPRELWADPPPTSR